MENDMPDTDPRSITERLAALGYTHKKAGPGTYAHRIFDAEGTEVFYGTTATVVPWMIDREKEAA